MKVVILCGGLGTRLREETEFRPKPMVMIGNRPIIWHIMKIYAHYGHKDFILCLGYKGEMIVDYFRNYLWNTCDVTIALGRNPQPTFHNTHAEEDWNVTLAETGETTMTASRVRQIQKYIPKGESFLLTYGDGVSDIDINASIQSHQKAGKACTLSAVHPSSRFGVVSLDDSNNVHFFQEKPQVDDAYINGGFMVCDQRIFDYMPDDPKILLEKEPMAALVRDKQLHSYRHDGFWQPMDTFRETSLLNQLWESGKAPWKVW
jgi:glucose-1-phosphate cytidylyltransferase